MFGDFQFKAPVGAGGGGSGGPPSVVGRPAAFAGSHLMDPSRNELAQTHKGVWAQGRGVVVITWCREETSPLIEEGFLLKIRLCQAESGLGFIFFLCLWMCPTYTQTRLIQEHLVHNTRNLFLLRDPINPAPEKFPETFPP